MLIRCPRGTVSDCHAIELTCDLVFAFEQSLSDPGLIIVDQAHLRMLMKKRRNARRLKFSVLVVPAALIIITLSTRYMSHPAVLDVFSGDSAAPGWRALAASVLDWEGNIHERHDKRELEYQLDLEGRSPQTASGISFPSETATSASTASATATATSIMTASETDTSTTPTATVTDNSAAPTIPAEAPVLPTPFPQPFDSTGITTNFSTDGCREFFVNMTQTAPFRECRPFSLLVQHSSAFIEAQFNLTELNSIIWGTCNTDLSADQCEENMAYFADALQDACSTDLKANNQVAVSSLLGLQAYSFMRETGCLSSSTNTYCYVSAFSSTAHPADAYYYTLPLGTALPNASDPSCSSCTQHIMEGYVDQGLNTSGLQQTYAAAAVLTNKVCGTGFVQEMETKSSAAERARGADVGWWVATSVCVVSTLIAMAGAW
ncbi:hypothetical protein EVJ58_g7385 [Rhodofomes roseus]|uniref:DUF7729 domain-containing protein n=1 Tax=Rhodofomes roseus TaxID=34475 RepID=A0A4Y9Y408_9APHY|nr:hypothetical protein EVJ58_g7385 [Rhodofomes roseus]